MKESISVNAAAKIPAINAKTAETNPATTKIHPRIMEANATSIP